MPDESFLFRVSFHRTETHRRYALIVGCLLTNTCDPAN